jgi:hypothetical protein
MRKIALVLLLFLLVGCTRQLTEEEKKKEWDRKAANRSTTYKPSDGAFGAKDFANDAKDASEKDTQETEQEAQQANQ